MRKLWDRPAVLSGLVGLLAGLVMLANQADAGDKKGGSTLKVKEGQPAPNVELPATQIESALPGKKGAKLLPLSAFKGKKNVVLFFYPKALTGG